MNPINCLFIGGAKDGQWMSVEEWRNRIEVPIRAALHPLRVGEAINEFVEITVQVYKAMPFAGEKTRYTVYALEGMTSDDVMAALINGYKKS